MWGSTTRTVAAIGLLPKIATGATTRIARQLGRAARYISHAQRIRGPVACRNGRSPRQIIGRCECQPSRRCEADLISLSKTVAQTELGQKKCRELQPLSVLRGWRYCGKPRLPQPVRTKRAPAPRPETRSPPPQSVDNQDPLVPTRYSRLVGRIVARLRAMMFRPSEADQFSLTPIGVATVDLFGSTFACDSLGGAT